MKKDYQKPEMEIVEIESYSSILATSGNVGGGDASGKNSLKFLDSDED